MIEIEGLGKRYRLGESIDLARNFRETLMSLPRHFGRKARLAGRQLARSVAGGGAGAAAEERRHIWALRDLDLTIAEGEVVGIIGRNGAGKSTLLKILSRITMPTTGRARIHGRLSSLLEVGTGFHPELTGRENIFLNGAILGMRRAEIERKFDEIVAFAETEPFLDTPVKRYSSGMRVRLAFAVAAHLEPEVLVVDEVLSVGDASFQKKCLGKMNDVARGGRTVLFVSHNMAALQNLCTSACLLEQGRLVYRGEVDQGIARYLDVSASTSATPLGERIDRRGSGKVRLTAIRLAPESGSSVIYSGDSLRIELDYESREPLHRPQIIVDIYDIMNQPLFRLDTLMDDRLPAQLPRRGRLVCRTGPLNATPGPCLVNVAVVLFSEMVDHVFHATEFSIEPSDFYGTGRMFNRSEALFLLPQQWALEGDPGQ